jgi:protoheme IX farnesyltransferase
VTFSAYAAIVLVSEKIIINLISPLASIFLIACGASVLNQYQERTQDAMMNRTKDRPIPSGRLSPQKALLISTLLLVSGLGILIREQYWTCSILGIINLLWYNGLYTWLKKKSAFAVVPGAISGVIPVFMGCTAAGGALLNPLILLLALFLFIWQIPHFWLLMLKFEDEYRLAGFPVMTDIFNIKQFKNIILAWMIGATGTSLFLVGSGLWILLWSKIIIIGLNMLILGFFFQQLMFATKLMYKIMAGIMNTFLLIVLIMIILDKIFY